jgi:hypothetical protein
VFAGATKALPSFVQAPDRNPLRPPFISFIYVKPSGPGRYLGASQAYENTLTKHSPQSSPTHRAATGLAGTRARASGRGGGRRVCRGRAPCAPALSFPLRQIRLSLIVRPFRDKAVRAPSRAVRFCAGHRPGYEDTHVVCSCEYCLHRLRARSHPVKCATRREKARQR